MFLHYHLWRVYLEEVQQVSVNTITTEEGSSMLQAKHHPLHNHNIYLKEQSFIYSYE